MQPGAVLVDVAIDQGGCGQRPRAHEPTPSDYVVDQVGALCLWPICLGPIARTRYQGPETMPPCRSFSRWLQGEEALLRRDPHVALVERCLQGKNSLCGW